MLKKRAVLQGAALFHSRSGNYFSCVGKSGSLVIHKEKMLMQTCALPILLICAAPSALVAQVNPGTAQGDVSVTIYSNDLALVQDVRQLNIKAGTNRLEFPDVSAQIRPETVSFSAEGASIVEQNFDFDLLSPDKLMEKAVRSEERLVGKECGSTC